MPSVTLWTVRMTRAAPRPPWPERPAAHRVSAPGLWVASPLRPTEPFTAQRVFTLPCWFFPLPSTPQHSEDEPCWGILRVAGGQARMDIGAVCRGELFSNRSPWQQPHSSGRSHIPRPVSGTRRACWQSLYCSTQHSWGGRARKGCSEPSQQEDMCTECLASWEEGSKQSWPPETPGMEEASRQLPRKK